MSVIPQVYNQGTGLVGSTTQGGVIPDEIADLIVTTSFTNLGDTTLEGPVIINDTLTVNGTTTVQDLNVTNNVVLNNFQTDNATVLQTLTSDDIQCNTLTAQQSVTANTLNATNDITAGNDITATGDISGAGADFSSDSTFGQDVTIDNCLTVTNGDIDVVGGNIIIENSGLISEEDITINNGDLYVTNGDVSCNNVAASNNITCGNDITAVDDITAGGTVTATSLSATVGQISGVLGVTGFFSDTVETPEIGSTLNNAFRLPTSQPSAVGQVLKVTALPAAGQAHSTTQWQDDETPVQYVIYAGGTARLREVVNGVPTTITALDMAGTLTAGRIGPSGGTETFELPAAAPTLGQCLTVSGVTPSVTSWEDKITYDNNTSELNNGGVAIDKLELTTWLEANAYKTPDGNYMQLPTGTPAAGDAIRFVSGAGTLLSPYVTEWS